MEQPRLPWEVVERIIEHSGDYPKTLSSFSLTCRQLRPRTCCVRFDQTECRDEDHVLAFRNLLQDSPDLKCFVRLIAVQPDALSSFPLLHLLPRLPEIVFRRPSRSHGGSDSPPVMYQSSLTYFRRFGTHIHSLRLSSLSFATDLQLARLLLAFPNVVDLNCTDIKIEGGGDEEYLDSLRRRLAKQMRLKTLTVSHLSPLLSA